MIDTDRYEETTVENKMQGVRMPLGIIPKEDILAMLEPIRECRRDNKILLAEVERLREELVEIEYRLEIAEDVLGRSDWNTIYRDIIDGVELKKND